MKINQNNNQKNIYKTNCQPPPQGMWEILEINELGKKGKNERNTTTCKKSRTKNQGKIIGKP